MAGTLFVVATPIGNLEDITARALRVLREVALIAAEDTRRTSQLLSRYGIATRTTSLHEHNERQKTDELLTRLGAGESIALVSDAGTPTVSDPGSHFIAAAIARGVRVEPIPGPSAVMAALSVSGFELDGFSFLGFPPQSGTARRRWFERLSALGPCVVFYEAPHRIRFSLEDLQRSIGDVEVVVGREVTKVHEEFLRGPISSVLGKLQAGPLGEFTIVVYFGHKAERVRLSAPPTALDVLLEFSQMTDSGGLTRRQAISKLSKNHGLSAKEVYSLVEAGKISAR